MSKVYIYVVARDFGFAPNPFHGTCTLATCKPAIRSTAKLGDWIFGLGGRDLKATGRCVFAMKVTQKLTFNQYWLSEEFHDKKPVRNGSKRMLLGDNIYFQHPDNSWTQEHSHHSLQDGRVNEHNLERDTKSPNVLISSHFYYFGITAPFIPGDILSVLGYSNRIGHSIFSEEQARELIFWIENEFQDSLNKVKGKPFNFDMSAAHYSVETNKITNI